jgi:hypothetical protein
MIGFVAGGATCARRQTIAEFVPPVVFESTPSLPELTEHINRSLKIQRLESNTLAISSAEMTTRLAGSLAWERPHNFSLRAYPFTEAMGIAFAAGSNAEMFWLQQQMPSPPTIYYARHDQFARQTGPRSILPVSPLWLREALGVVELDPALHHNGPTLRPDGKLEIESYIPSPQGDYRRILVIDAGTATIEQTLLYSHVGALVALAQQSEHQYYSAIDWNLPHRVDVNLQPDEGPPLAFTIRVEHYLLNESNASGAAAFTPPDPTGLSIKNLAPGGTAPPATAPTPPVYTQSHAHTTPLYRTLR